MEPWTGKVVIFYLRQGGRGVDGGVPIEDPRVEESLGDSFVVGRTPRAEDDWGGELPTGVRLRDVHSYLCFASVEDYLLRVRQGQRTSNATGSRRGSRLTDWLTKGRR
ncbi:MAG: hypothetical protein AMXMBFR36_21520 [Acidobacteriota bacterium]